jgi:hypothetical protein
MSTIVNNKTINRIKRVTDLIDENAKLATPGRWAISHSHVYGTQIKDLGGGKCQRVYFDIASQPYERKQCVYGVHPDNWDSYKDMKHIVTCEPTVMTKLVADVRELLTEREDPRALVANMINALADDESHAAFKLGKALEAYQASLLPPGAK